MNITLFTIEIHCEIRFFVRGAYLYADNELLSTQHSKLVWDLELSDVDVDTHTVFSFIITNEHLDWLSDGAP